VGFLFSELISGIFKGGKLIVFIAIFTFIRFLVLVNKPYIWSIGDMMLIGKRCALITVIILFIFVSPCNAEPDSTIRYLMNEPISMLDFGLYRLGLELEWQTKGHIEEGYRKSDVMVSYDWGKNRIFLRRLWILREDIDVDTLKDECKREIRLFRLVVNFALLENCFRHSGFTSKKEPENLLDNLLKIMEIKIEAMNLYKKKGIVCSAPLLGKDIYFMEKMSD